MKRTLLFSFLVLGIIFAGCSDKSTIVNPDGTDLNKQVVQQTTPTLIKLPFTSLDKANKVKAKIKGKEGGSLELHGKLKSGIKYEAKLVVPAGAFKGEMKITLKLDKKHAGFVFGPSGAVFNKQLLLTAKIKGLNLDGIDTDKVQFGFVDSDGNFSPVVYKKIKVDIEDGLLKVIKAQIWHFSRYNWAK